MSDINKLREYAKSARKVLENYAKTERTGVFARFPYGCCRDSAYLILKYAMDKDMEGLCLVSATSTVDTLNRATHAWLQLGDYVVDITADQFNGRLEDQMPKIYVSKDRSWHDKYFSEQNVEDGDIFFYGFNNYFNAEKDLMDSLLSEIETSLSI